MPARSASSGSTQRASRAWRARATNASSRRHRVRRRLQRRDVRRQSFDQRVEQALLARQCAFPRGERAVLEGLQFRGDVALGVLQRLAPPVVIGHLRRLAVRDLDVKAVHAVVLDPKVGDAGARALALLEVDQELACVVAQGPQLVEFGIVSSRDDIAVADRVGGLCMERGAQRRNECRRQAAGLAQIEQPRRFSGREQF